MKAYHGSLCLWRLWHPCHLWRSFFLFLFQQTSSRRRNEYGSDSLKLIAKAPAQQVLSISLTFDQNSVNCNTAVGAAALWAANDNIRKERWLFTDTDVRWVIWLKDFYSKDRRFIRRRQGIKPLQQYVSATTCSPISGTQHPKGSRFTGGKSWKYVVASGIYPLIIVYFFPALLWFSIYMSMYLNILLSGRRFQ